jgi:hypothetical protein
MSEFKEVNMDQLQNIEYNDTGEWLPGKLLKRSVFNDTYLVLH